MTDTVSRKKGNDPFLSEFKKQSLVFTLGPATKARFLKNFEVIEGDVDKEEKFKAHTDNFSILSGYYLQTHETYARTLLERLIDYLRANYQKEFEQNQQGFKIYCYDADCPNSQYTKKLDELYENIKKATFKSSFSQSSILLKVDEAKKLDDTERYNKYTTIFSLILSEWRETKDPALEKLALDTKEIIKGEFGENFEIFSANGDFDIK